MNDLSGKHIHFIAIGGAAMHNMAIALHHKGFKVTGTDDEIFEPSRGRLMKHGLLPDEPGWDPSKITTDIDAVILGMHARKDNPELRKARELGLKIYSYPAYIYQETQDKKRVVIGGSHGKTTITSMVMHVLKSANLQFDYLVGSIVEGFDAMVNLKPESEIAVIEGDEYLSSPLDPSPKFHHYKPHIAVLTGIAWDHVNVFPTIENYHLQFERFIERIEPGGTLYYYKNDPVLSEIVSKTNGSIEKVAYTMHPARIHENQTTLLHDSVEYAINFFGKHNLQNVMAAKLVCQQLGIDDSEFYNSIATFTGAGKRLQLIAENHHSKMFMDFAHSPSKLTATIEAVREQYPDKKLIACMELHTYSSLQQSFLHQYKDSMKSADVPIVFYLPDTVRHKKLELFNPDDVINAFNDQRIMVVNNAKHLQDKLMSEDYRNTILLLMSSGNFSGIDLKALANKFI